jgi:hypothetical protein
MLSRPWEALKVTSSQYLLRIWQGIVDWRLLRLAEGKIAKFAEPEE